MSRRIWTKTIKSLHVTDKMWVNLVSYYCISLIDAHREYRQNEPTTPKDVHIYTTSRSLMNGSWRNPVVNQHDSTTYEIL